MMVHIDWWESSWPCLSALFDQWLTWKSPPVSAPLPPPPRPGPQLLFQCYFSFRGRAGSLLSGFRDQSRRLAFGQVHIAGEIEERGHRLCENPISNKQKKIYTTVTLAEAKLLFLGLFCTHLLERRLTDSTQPPYPTLAVCTSHVTISDFLSVLNVPFLPSFWPGIMDFSPSGIFFIVYYFSS